MSQALFTGVTGLLSHQLKLDLVANNLANMNTTAYKTQRLLFADLMYSNVRTATAGDNRLSGTNPIQRGFGVGAASSGRNFSQGVLTSTGQTFDFAIEGTGFFVVNIAGENRFTRDGAFELDRDGHLVDPVTGGYVQRFGGLGEGDDSNPAFQVRGDNRVRVPLGAAISGRVTSELQFVGNLPSNATQDAAEILTTATPYQAGGVAATAATLLNDLDSIMTPYQAGDEIKLTGFTFDGTPMDATLAVDDTTTLGDLLNFINSNLGGSQASLSANGSIRIVADASGVSKQQIELADGTTNVGGIGFNFHNFVEEVKGKASDTVETTLQVFDARGQAHNMNVTLTKMNGHRWDAAFELLDSTGSVVDGSVGRIEFTESGAYNGTFGTGIDNASIEIHFDQMNFGQPIRVDFSRMTHLANRFTASIEQDGFPPGNLVNVGIAADGTLEGIATNGRRVPIAQLAIADFMNHQGLEAVGLNYFRETVNSGLARFGTGSDEQHSIVRGGQLESSNVDVALEFTQLIVAQRGYSANAKTITVANEMLQELNMILR